MTLLLLLACVGDQKDTGPSDDTGVSGGGALGAGPLNPFPNAELFADGHVAIPAGLLPQVPDGTAMDVTRFAWREGYSRVQVSVARLDVPIDPESLSGAAGLGTGGSVRMYDLDSGVEIPCFAELDAYPAAIESGERSLLVRPGRAMTAGHTVAVAVTSAVTSDGAPLSLPAWEAAKAADPHYAALADTLDGLGVSDLALAWDFPVGDATAPMRAIAAAITTPTAYTLDRVRNADDEAEGNLPAGIWKKIEGSYTADNWLVDDVVFDTIDGLAAAQGTSEAELYAYVPDTARTLAPGTAPVLVFGHGFLVDPDHYFDNDDDESAVIDVANRLGAIVVGTVWRGLNTRDQVDTVQMAADFGRFPELTDRLTQGVANNLSLIRMVADGPLLDDPEFGGLADRSRIYWYGISLGSIEGVVTLANQDTIEHAVLHVGGSAWSTMLERSSNWSTFELLVQRTIPDPWERQVLYSATQMLWDPVDPVSYADELSARSWLWQESIGDDQVPNLATEILMRSAGIPLGTPGVNSPLDVDDLTLPTMAPAFVQFDPELGAPSDANRPADITHAHETPRTWEGCKAQTVAFFAPGAEGEVTHWCGDGPCTAEATGE